MSALHLSIWQQQQQQQHRWAWQFAALETGARDYSLMAVGGSLHEYSGKLPEAAASYFAGIALHFWDSAWQFCRLGLLHCSSSHTYASGACGQYGCLLLELSLARVAHVRCLLS